MDPNIRFKKKSKIFDISDKSVALIIKKYLNYPNLDSYIYPRHSLRSEFVTFTTQTSTEKRNIMAITGHKSLEMVRSYIKEINLFKIVH